MIKECNVVLRNLSVVVVEFEGKRIQMPCDNSKDEKVYVMFENGKYTMSTKEDYEKSLKPKAVKKPKKVETIDEVVESEAVENETDEISE